MTGDPLPRSRVVPSDPDCPLCGHAWKRHDPEDGCCDAHAEEGFGACPCGRNRLWMAGRIAHLSKLFLIPADSQGSGTDPRGKERPRSSEWLEGAAE